MGGHEEGEGGIHTLFALLDVGDAGLEFEDVAAEVVCFAGCVYGVCGG